MNAELYQAILAQPMSTVADCYASCLAGNAKALAFVCDELKLTPEQAAQQRIGFSDRSLGTQLPSKKIKSGRKVREQLISLGLYKGNGRETLRGYVTMPVVDEDGQTIAIRGYKLDPGSDGPAVILVVTDDSSRHSPSAVTNAAGTISGAVNYPTKEEPAAMQGIVDNDVSGCGTESEESCGTRSVPTTVEDLAIDNGQQRTIHTQEIDGEMLQYINVTVDGIAVAGRLAAELLGRSLDELSPQTRRFLNRLSRYVSDTATETRIPRDSVRFTRRDIRQRLGMEYVLPHRGKNGQRYVYELLYDGDVPQSQPHFSGLIDPQELSESAGKNVVMNPTLSIAEATLSIS